MPGQVDKWGKALGVGHAGHENEPFQAPFIEQSECDEERDAPTHGMTDKGESTEVFLQDQAVHEVSMIVERVKVVGGYRRRTVALQLHRPHPVVLRQGPDPTQPRV